MTSKKTINLFYSYSHKDEALRDTLETHLKLLKRQNVIDTWHDRKIMSGTEWGKAIDENLETADIILLLISADFLASDYCWDIEIQRAMQRHEENSAVVIPVSLRPCDTGNAVFMKLQGLPKNFKPVTTWPIQDEAFTDIAQGIRATAEVIRKSTIANTQHSNNSASAGLFTVPFVDEHFIGREQELTLLNELFLTSNKVALTGLGGVGKTRLAVHYCYLQKQRYAFILWLSASSKASLDDSLSQHADKLNADPMLKQAEKIAFVKAWLEQHKDWLLIIDNADNDQEINAKVLQEFLPVSPQGHILFTTQIITADLKFKAAALEIKCLETAGGLFLWQRIHGDTQATPDDMTAAQQISDALSGLPLALAQAAAYIKENQCALTDYLPFFEKYAKELLNPDLTDYQQVISDHDLPVFATFKLSFSRLPEPAKDLLAFCALLHAESIPEEILISAYAVDDFALNQRLKPVLQYGLMVRNQPGKTLALHRLVQQVLLLDMDDARKQHYAELAIPAMNEILPVGDVEFKDWQQYERLLQSGLACVKWITHYQLETEHAVCLLNQIAGYLYAAKANYTKAEPLYQRSLAIMEKTLGKDQSGFAHSLNNLALLYDAQGKYEQAEPLYQRSIAIMEKALGKDHSDVAPGLNNLAAFYFSQGKYELAEPLYQRSLAIREKALGKDHPDVATGLNNLALLYDAQGKYEQAERLVQRSLAIKEKALGKDHPDVATILNNLAWLYHAQGKYELAEPLVQRSLAIKEKALGKNHSAVAVSLYNLAKIYRTQGKHEQAEPLYQRSLAIFEKSLGIDHPDTKQVREDYELFLAEKVAGK